MHSATQLFYSRTECVIVCKFIWHSYEYVVFATTYIVRNIRPNILTLVKLAIFHQVKYF